MRKILFKNFTFCLILPLVFIYSNFFVLNQSLAQSPNVSPSASGISATPATSANPVNVSPTPVIEEIGVGQTQEFSDPAFTIKLTVGDQEFPSKRFFLKFSITSIIESGKIGIDWIYPKSYFQIEGPERDRIDSLVPGQTIVITKYFTPTNNSTSSSGTIKKVEFGSRIIALIPDVNYLSSTKITADFNNEWEIIPQGDQYQTEKSVKTILGTVLWIVIIVGVGVVLIIGIRRFLKYLNTDDVQR